MWSRSLLPSERRLSPESHHLPEPPIRFRTKERRTDMRNLWALLKLLRLPGLRRQEMLIDHWAWASERVSEDLREVADCFVPSRTVQAVSWHLGYSAKFCTILSVDTECREIQKHPKNPKKNKKRWLSYINCWVSFWRWPVTTILEAWSFMDLWKLANTARLARPVAGRCIPLFLISNLNKRRVHK